MKGSAFLTLLVVLAGQLSGCSKDDCDCPSDVVGLVITTGAPVTSVSLSGNACRDGRFRCIPASYDNVVHDDCKRLQIEARTEGSCVVSLTVGGQPVQIERAMTRRPDGCCGGFIGEANHAGTIDLREKADGGVD